MKKLYSVLLIVFSIQNINAQLLLPQTPCATAMQGTAGNMIINYTIGEMVLVQQWQSNGLYISQGIMQPDLFNNFVFLNGFVPGEITVFPNPTPNLLSIQISLLKPGKLSLQLTDALGQIIISDDLTISSFLTQKYDMSRYASATYFLKLRYKSNDGVQDKKGTYKLVKQ